MSLKKRTHKNLIIHTRQTRHNSMQNFSTFPTNAAATLIGNYDSIRRPSQPKTPENHRETPENRASFHRHCSRTLDFPAPDANVIQMRNGTRLRMMFRMINDVRCAMYMVRMGTLCPIAVEGLDLEFL